MIAIFFNKCEARWHNNKDAILAAVVFHNLCINFDDPYRPKLRLTAEELRLINSDIPRLESRHSRAKSLDFSKKIANWLWELRHYYNESLPEKCPSTEFFLFHIFLYSDTFHAVNVYLDFFSFWVILPSTLNFFEAVHQIFFDEKVFWKYPAHLQENVHVRLRFS